MEVVGEVDGLVELSDAIGIVREQLVATQVAGRQVAAGQVVTFAVGKVSIEFSGEVKKATSGGGGLKFWVVTAEAKAERSSGAVHKVSVELIPQTPDGRAYIVNDSLSEIPEQ